jgi:hypothetical protein
MFPPSNLTTQCFTQLAKVSHHQCQQQWLSKRNVGRKKIVTLSFSRATQRLTESCWQSENKKQEKRERERKKERKKERRAEQKER